MSNFDFDVSEISKGTQVSYEHRNITRIGIVTKYLGDCVYLIEDDCGNEDEVHIKDITIEED